LKVLRKWIFLLLIIVAIHFTNCSSLNRFQKEGTINLPGLKGPVTVLRDDKGMAYIYAQNINDALMAQGFVTAQDRLFQMELTKLFATGRISELAGFHLMTCPSSITLKGAGSAPVIIRQ